MCIRETGHTKRPMELNIAGISAPAVIHWNDSITMDIIDTYENIYRRLPRE